MNIVIVSAVLPYPLSSGGAQAQFNMIEELRHRHNVTFIFPENGGNSRSAMRSLAALWPNVRLRCYAYVWQLLNMDFFLSKVRRAFGLLFCSSCASFQQERVLASYGYVLDERFRRFLLREIRQARADVVEVDFFPFLELADMLPSDLKRVFVHHELRFVRNERLLASFLPSASLERRMEAVRVQELRLLSGYDAVLVLTDVDARLLRAQGVRPPVLVSPAAVRATLLDYTGWNGLVSFLGGYAHFPNQEGVDWFLRQVCPLLPAAVRSSLRFQIIGGGWPASYEGAHGLSCVRRGFVTHLGDALYGSLMVVPILSGSGMRMKILEAAAMGVPLLTTSVGVEGLDFRHEESCLVADTAVDFALALARLMGDDALRRRLSAGARRVYDTHYSVSALTHLRERILLELVQGKD